METKKTLLLLLLLLGLSVQAISALGEPSYKETLTPASTEIARDAVRLSLEDVHATIRFIGIFSGLHSVDAMGSIEAHRCAREMIHSLRDVRGLLHDLEIRLFVHHEVGPSEEDVIGEVREAFRSSFIGNGRGGECYKVFEGIDGEMTGMVQRRIESMVSSTNDALAIVERSSGVGLMVSEAAFAPQSSPYAGWGAVAHIKAD